MWFENTCQRNCSWMRTHQKVCRRYEKGYISTSSARTLPLSRHVKIKWQAPDVLTWIDQPAYPPLKIYYLQCISKGASTGQSSVDDSKTNVVGKTDNQWLHSQRRHILPNQCEGITISTARINWNLDIPILLSWPFRRKQNCTLASNLLFSGPVHGCDVQTYGWSPGKHGFSYSQERLKSPHCYWPSTATITGCALERWDIWSSCYGLVLWSPSKTSNAKVVESFNCF